MVHSPVRIFIVEDIAVNRLMLETLLQQNGFEVVGTAVDAQDALDKITLHLPDMVLLDIQLKGELTGTWLGHQINEKLGIPFIYITAYQDPYTTEEVLKTNPLGFIVKPINAIQLITTMNIALNIRREHSQDFVKLNDGRRSFQIDPNELLYIQSESNYVHIYLKNNHLLIRGTLPQLLEKLPSAKMIRIHQRTAINANARFDYNGSEIYIQGKSLPISITYKEEVAELLKR